MLKFEKEQIEAQILELLKWVLITIATGTALLVAYIFQKIFPVIQTKVFPEIPKEVLTAIIGLQFLIIILLIAICIPLYKFAKKKQRIELRGPSNHYKWP